MKKIKLLTPILGLTALASAMMPLASCSSKKEETGTTVPSDAFEVKDVTLKGFKEDYDFSKYEKLVIPSNVKVIDTNAFKELFVKDCKIKTVVMPGNVETIRAGAFADNPRITTYDFSGFDVDSIHALTVESGAFGDLESNGIYSYVKMNDNWTQVQKDALKLKLINAGVPKYWFVGYTEGNVELVGDTKEQTANGGEATHEFKIKGEYTYNLKYAAVLSRVDGTEGVTIDTMPEVEVSGDFKSVKIPVKMVAEEGHEFKNEDWVSYKISIICYTEKTTSNGETTQTGKWIQTIETFKLVYKNVLSKIKTNGPSKTKYKDGEKFDPTGLVIHAEFTNGQTKDIKWDGDIVRTNLDDHEFTEEEIVYDRTIVGTAYYTNDGITKECTFEIDLVAQKMFTINASGHVTLKSEYISAETIYVPEYIEGTKVVGIADSGLSGAKFSTITFAKPENITYIGESAFNNCSNIKSFKVPENVKIIKSNAFKDCSSLTEVTFEKTANWFQGDKGINVFTPATNATNLKNCTSGSDGNWGYTGIDNATAINVTYGGAYVTFIEEEGYNPKSIKTNATSINIKFTGTGYRYEINIFQNGEYVAQSGRKDLHSPVTETLNFEKELDSNYELYVAVSIYH